MSDQTSIEERENGPLIIKNAASVEDADGNAVELKPVMALCRCGASANKPFCDGSHNESGFESRGGKPAGRDRLIEYAGEAVTVVYNPMVCSHAAECGKRAGDIFDTSKKPWVMPDNGSIEALRDAVSNCPSGALHLKDEGHMIADGAQITIEKNGPYRIRHVSPPVEVNGEGMTAQKYVLCRCGKSGNKPFCDGSHSDVGWSDT
jgi:CDGSH-type Zn-finger protein